MLSAGAKNITCIETYPRDFLKTNPNKKLIKKRLQDTDIRIFEDISVGDFLFIY